MPARFAFVLLLALASLAKGILTNQEIMKNGTLNNTQVVLSRDGEVKSVRVKNESLDKKTRRKWERSLCLAWAPMNWLVSLSIARFVCSSN